MRGAIIMIAAGVAMATPATAKRDTDLPCPIMPTTNDVEFSRERGASFQIGKVGFDAKAARSSSAKDIMMKEGRGFRDWSAAVLLSYTCEANKRAYPGDYQRQKDELIFLRNQLVDPPRNPPRSKMLQKTRVRYRN